LKGFRPDFVVPGCVRIEYTHTSKTVNEKKGRSALRIKGNNN